MSAPANQLNREQSRALLAASFSPRLRETEAVIVENAVRQEVERQKRGRVKPAKMPRAEKSGDPFFAGILTSAGVPQPIKEYRFYPARRWRLDYAWPTHRVALEVDGGLFSGGAHVNGARIKKTWERDNLLAGLGWRILRCEPRDLCRTDTINAIRAALAYSP